MILDGDILNIYLLIIYEIIAQLVSVVGLNYKSLHVVSTWIQISMWLA